MKLETNKYLMTRNGDLIEFWILCNPRNSDKIVVTNGWENHCVFKQDWKLIKTMSDLVKFSISRRMVDVNGKRRVVYMPLCDYLNYLKLQGKEANQDA